MEPDANTSVQVLELDDQGRPRTITGNFQMQMNLSQQRNLVVTGYIFSDDDIDKINKKLDDAQDAIDRQFIRCDLLNKEAQAKAILAEVERSREMLEALATKDAGDGLSEKRQRSKLSSQERMTLQNGQQNIKKQLDYVEGLRSAIKEGRAKLGLPVA